MGAAGFWSGCGCCSIELRDRRPTSLAAFSNFVTEPLAACSWPHACIHIEACISREAVQRVHHHVAVPALICCCCRPMSGPGVLTGSKGLQSAADATRNFVTAPRPQHRAVQARAAAAVSQQQQSVGPQQPQQQDEEARLPSGFEKSSCIILPTGKEFKLQIRYKNGRHPLLGFDAAGKPSWNCATAVTAGCAVPHQIHKHKARSV
jgi:hypothetical protein